MSFQPGRGSVESITFDTDTCAVSSNPNGTSAVNTTATVTLKDQAGVTPGFYYPLSGYVNKKGIITACGSGVSGSGTGSTSANTLSIRQTQDVANTATLDTLTATQIKGDNLDTTFNNFSTVSGYNQATGLFTAAKAGMYFAYMSIVWASSATGGRLIYIHADQSISSTGLYASKTLIGASEDASSTTLPMQTTSGMCYLGIGDTLRFMANQNSGGNLTANKIQMGIAYLGA